jgi:hypothetical protein
VKTAQITRFQRPEDNDNEPTTMQARYALVLAAHSETTTIDTSFLVCPPILPLTQLALCGRGCVQMIAATWSEIFYCAQIMIHVCEINSDANLGKTTARFVLSHQSDGSIQTQMSSD